MIKIGIIGYGNLAKGVECAIRQNPDMELKAVFTRRDPASVNIMTPDVPVLALSEAENWKDRIDVMILCGGSATDLPKMTPEFAKSFNVIDSFDTHAKIPEHFAAVDAAASAGGNVAFISVGWDPGLFSLNRLYASAILPQGQDYTFWGKGVSQGHSDAVRRIPGVLDCRQYTIPVPEAMDRVRSGENPQLTTVKSTPVTAMWWRKRMLTRLPSKPPSKPCPTTLQITIPPWSSSPWRKCAQITAVCPMAAA